MFTGMMPPQAAPPQPQSVEFRTVPGQRAQFKSFMQGMRAKPAMNPPISPPQIPVNVSPIDMIDIFDQPVQMMQRGGVLNRPMDDDNQSRGFKSQEVKSAIQKALERREKARQMDDSNEKRNFPKLTPTPTKRTQPITPEQESAARAALTNFAVKAAGGEDRAKYSDIADIINTFQPRRLSGLGDALSQQIADLQEPVNNNITRDLTGSQIDALNQSADLFSDENTDDGASLLAPNFLSRLPLVGDLFYKGQVQDATDFMSIPGASFDDVTGVGTAPIGSRGGELVLSPSGVITYRGQKDPNYSVDGPFANLIRPFDRKSKDVFQAPKAVTDPCPDGFQLVDGVCQPIASNTTATQTPMITAAPTATTPTTQVIVPSTRQSAPIEQVAPVAFPVDMISNLMKPFGMQEGGAVSDTLTAATDRFLESMRAAS